MDCQPQARFKVYSAPMASEWLLHLLDLAMWPGFKSWCDRDSLWSLPSPLISAWQVVGCDYNLDSSKQEDECLQCGGDGTTCYPVTGVFDANDLSRGGAPPGVHRQLREGSVTCSFLACLPHWLSCSHGT